VPHTLDAALLRRWAGAAVDALGARRAEIDRINVFPVADRDTGTNMLLTMRAATEEAGRLAREPSGSADVARALAAGALVGARGNSGVILAQFLRGIADTLAGALPVNGALPAPAGRALGAALARAAELSTAALADPREGTVLTVLAAAARAADGCRTDELDEVAAAAAAAAAEALADTTGQLVELAEAGVVDAGGLGLVVVLDALLVVITGEPVSERPAVVGRPARDRDALIAQREGGSGEYDYEVMFLLDGCADERATALRAELATIGDSVAIVGDGAGTWNVHVHCTDVGAAIEAGVAAGRPHRITVARFADQLAAADADLDRAAATGRFTTARAVLTVVAAAPIAALARGEGAAALLTTPPHRPDEAQLAAALAGTRARHVVLLPNDPELTPVAERAATSARRLGQDVVVVPTASVVQALAALAVHDPARRPGDDVVAMAEAAAATRIGGIQVAEAEALTWAGRCQPGDMLGLADGEVVLIEQDATAAARGLLDRMLGAGGELVTVLLGADATPETADDLEGHLATTHPEVEVVVYRGGQTDYLLVLGVE
jgi:DAK2 domain fusion protein YloV